MFYFNKKGISNQFRIIYNILILFGSISILITCSNTKFIYIFVDEFIKDEINYYLDLNDKEKNLLNKQISEMVTWHRTSMLPKYSEFLYNIADNLEDNQYSTVKVKKFLENGRFLINETVTGITPYVSQFLVQHQTVKNINFIENRMLSRRQKRIIELSKTKDKLYEERFTRLTSNFERFFGDLKDPQNKLLEVYARETLNDARIRLHNRTLRQKAFIKFLKTRPTELELTNFLNKLLLQGHLITNPSYETFTEISVKKFHRLLVNMLDKSSIIQREKIITKLINYAEDFKIVSGEDNL
tara:strand:+ start:2086 stop:2982 length:897 start_codon:yes stop_codon:yes gene_type:complete